MWLLYPENKISEGCGVRSRPSMHQALGNLTPSTTHTKELFVLFHKLKVAYRVSYYLIDEHSPEVRLL